MPPPQCPECGRFLATAFVEQITHEPAPCPRCGTELSLEDEATVGGVASPEEAPPVPPPSATLPTEEQEDDAADAGESEATAEIPVEDTTERAATELPAGEDAPTDAGLDVPPPAATLPQDVEPEPMTSVRPPDRDPLEGWDETTTVSPGAAAGGAADPAVLAAGAGIGLLVGLLLGGREHRGLGALLGAALGALLARLRGG